VLVLALNRSSTWRRVAHLVRGLLLAYWLGSLLALALAVAIGLFSGVLAGVLSFVLACTGLVLWESIAMSPARDRQRLRAVHGHERARLRRPGPHALLHDVIQTRRVERRATRHWTFGDLWNAPGFPPEGSALKPSVPSQIHQSPDVHDQPVARPPYVLPFEEGDAQRNQGLHAATQQRLFYRGTNWRAMCLTTS